MRDRDRSRGGNAGTCTQLPLRGRCFTDRVGYLYRQHSRGVIDRTCTGLNMGHIHVPRLLRHRSQSVWMDLHHQHIAYRASTLLLSYRREMLRVLCVDLNHSACALPDNHHAVGSTSERGSCTTDQRTISGPRTTENPRATARCRANNRPKIFHTRVYATGIAPAPSRSRTSRSTLEPRVEKTRDALPPSYQSHTAHRRGVEPITLDRRPVAGRKVTKGNAPR